VAPRSIWNGTVTFGLVAVPIKLYTATESKSVSFREVHARDGARIEHRRICSKEGREVPYEEVAHSYDLDGKQVIVTDEELASVQPRKRGPSTSRRLSTSPTSIRSSSTIRTSSFPPGRARARCVPTACLSRPWARPTGRPSGGS
jgi:hypothetical protein